MGEMDNVITVFKERQRHKRLEFERRVLIEISLKELSDNIRDMFSPFFSEAILYKGDVENVCMDIAIEAYLLGAEYSKFSYHGEPMSVVHKRCFKLEKALIEALFDYWLFWKTSAVYEESLQITCDVFVSNWWKAGCEKGMMRRRLRLQ